MADHVTPVIEGEGLPPQEFCAVDFSRPHDYYQQLETPVDERGLVDVDALIQLVKSTVDPEYQWPTRTSVHHFYHPAQAYPYRPFGDGKYNPASFRNLPIHRGLVPQQFHNMLHWVTKPSEMPEPQVMAYRVEAWKVVSNLFKMTRSNVQWERLAQRRAQLVADNPELLPSEFQGEDRIGQEVIAEIFEQNFRGIEHHREQHERIPADFRLIDLDGSPQEIAKNLGKIVMPRSLQLVRRVAA